MRKRRARSLEGHVYRRGRIWWFKWTSLDGQRMYRSSGSLERAVAEEMLRAELSRKSKGLPSSPDPWRCRVDELLETLQARYRTEGRRSLERLKYSKEQLLRLFGNVPAARVTGHHFSFLFYVLSAGQGGGAAVEARLCASVSLWLCGSIHSLRSKTN